MRFILKWIEIFKKILIFSIVMFSTLILTNFAYGNHLKNQLKEILRLRGLDNIDFGNSDILDPNLRITSIIDSLSKEYQVLRNPLALEFLLHLYTPNNSTEWSVEFVNDEKSNKVYLISGDVRILVTFESSFDLESSDYGELNFKVLKYIEDNWVLDSDRTAFLTQFIDAKLKASRSNYPNDKLFVESSYAFEGTRVIISHNRLVQNLSKNLSTLVEMLNEAVIVLRSIDPHLNLIEQLRKGIERAGGNGDKTPKTSLIQGSYLDQIGEGANNRLPRAYSNKLCLINLLNGS